MGVKRWVMPVEVSVEADTREEAQGRVAAAALRESKYLLGKYEIEFTISGPGAIRPERPDFIPGVWPDEADDDVIEGVVIGGAEEA